MHDRLREDSKAYWNDEAGPSWVKAQRLLDLMCAPITAQLLDRLASRSGDRVLDVGCGSGTIALSVASSNGPSRVLGVDISKPLVDHARSRVQGQTNLEVLLADAEVHDFEPRSFDAVVSRFGVMFFADSVRAFRNLHRSLAPGGRCVFACWQGREGNRWMTESLELLSDLVEIPESTPIGDFPGPFRFAQREPTRAMLEQAGYRGVEIEAFEPMLSIEAPIDELVAFFCQVGPVRGVLAEAPPDLRSQVVARLRGNLERQHDGRGIRFSAKTWIVSACVGVGA